MSKSRVRPGWVRANGCRGVRISPSVGSPAGGGGAAAVAVSGAGVAGGAGEGEAAVVGAELGPPGPAGAVGGVAARWDSS